MPSAAVQPRYSDRYVVPMNSRTSLRVMLGARLLEPNTYECPIRTIRTYWAENLIFDKKMSCSAQYVRMAMTLKILQVLIILPLKIYKFTKDNSTHGNFVQGQLDPPQFRPRTTRPTAISSKDNSTYGNFVQGQLDPRQFRPKTTRPTAISSIFNRGCLYKD